MMAEKSSIAAVQKRENASASALINCLMKPTLGISVSARAHSRSSFTQTEIKELFRTAHRVVKEPELTILLAPQKAEMGRLLIIIPRSVGIAVARNHLRRQLKSIFHEQKLYEYGSDCIVITRPGATKLSFARLQELLLEAFSTLTDRESP